MKWESKVTPEEMKTGKVNSIKASGISKKISHASYSKLVNVNNKWPTMQLDYAKLLHLIINLLFIIIHVYVHNEVQRYFNDK